MTWYLIQTACIKFSSKGTPAQGQALNPDLRPGVLGDNEKVVG